MDSQSLHSKASQDTLASLASLVQLDPLPIESPSRSNTEKDLPPLPEAGNEDSGSDSKSRSPTRTTTGTSSIGLSGTGHGSIYYRTSPVQNKNLQYPCTNPPPTQSNPHPALLLLRLLPLRLPPPRNNLAHPPRRAVRPLVRVLPPPRPGNLPDPALRTVTRRSADPRAHRLRHRPPLCPSRAKHPPLWRASPRQPV